MSSASGIGGVGGNQQPLSTNADPAKDIDNINKVDLGFSKDNTISHEGTNPLKNHNIQRTKVGIPEPEIKIGDVTVETLEELDNATGALGNFSLDGIFDQDGDGVHAFDEIFDAVASGDITTDEAMVAKLAEEGLQGADMETWMDFEARASDVFMHLNHIESAPPEVMDSINNLTADAQRALSMGNIEDVAAILSKIQTQLRDTRIKFDQEGLQAAKQARETVHAGRIDKLLEAIKKMEEKAKSGLVGKIFGAIATALAMVVGTVLIATGVLSKVGIALMVASIGLMAAITISQNTGNWMNKIFGNDKYAQLAAGIMWSVIAIALSLGASAATSKKAAVDIAQQSATFASKLAIHAKTVGHVAKMGAAASMATSGSAEIHGARVGYEGEMYKASAMDDLAEMTKFQQYIDDMLEAIEKAIKEIDEGQQVASTMMKESLDSKYNVSKNI